MPESTHEIQPKSRTHKVEAPENSVFALDDDIGFVALVDRMQADSALKVVNAARISYNKEKTAFDEGLSLIHI